METKDLVHVGTFGQPQGLKGDIKINIFTSSLESFKILNKYFIKNEDEFSNLFFKSIKKIGKKNIASIDQSKDRDEALTFRGKNIFTLRQNFPEIKSDEHYIIDLIGCNVIDTKDQVLGIVEDIKNFGAGDLIEIKSMSKDNFYIPMNKENLINIDVEKKTIFVDPIPGLLD